jgi:hypothetical protein
LPKTDTGRPENNAQNLCREAIQFPWNFIFINASSEMPNTQSIVALAETGRVVLISQSFEKLLIELLEFRKLHQNFDYATSTAGTMSSEMYKMALMNGVKRLREQNALHPTLDQSLVKYIEDRHILIHRWAISNGFPDDADVSAWNALHTHASSVAKQATELFAFFSQYLARYAMPDAAAKDYDFYQAQMLNMFNRKFPAQ